MRFLIYHGIIFLILVWTLRKEPVLAGAAAFVGVILAFILSAIPRDMVLNMLIMETAVLMVYLLVTLKGKNFFSFLRIRKIRPALLPILFLESWLLLLAASFLNACSELYFPNGAKGSLSMAMDYFPASLLVFCLAPAIAEEVTFRGGVLRCFRDFKKGIIISALLFAIWHMNLNQMSYALLAGLLLGILVVVTDNLVSGMIIHFLFNLYNLLAVRFQETAGGGIMYYPERLRGLLLPALKDGAGNFVWRSFFQGSAVFIVSVVLYLFILYKAGGEEADSKTAARHKS